MGALARMAKVVEVSDTIVPEQALDLAMRYHPERAWVFWAAWREKLPFQSGRAERLLLHTLGLNKALLSHWASNSGDELAPVVDEWFRRRGRSKRFELAQAFLAETENPVLRAALKLEPKQD